MSKHGPLSAGKGSASPRFLIPGQDYLAAHPHFQLAGRAEELKMAADVLMRSDANSLVLAGAGGVGITSLILGLEAAKEAPDTPFDLAVKRFYWLDTDGLFSSGDPATIQKNFDRMIDQLSRHTDSVLVVQNAREFIEAANSRGYSHFINALILALDNGKFQAIFECRDHDLQDVVTCHPYVKQIFTVREIKEPEGATLKPIITSAARRLEQYHGIQIGADAIDMAIHLMQQFHVTQIDRAQPDRTLALLDHALTSYRHTAHTALAGLDANARAALRTQLRTVRQEQIDIEAQLGDVLETPDGQQDEKAQAELQNALVKKRAEYDALIANINGDLTLTDAHVAAEFSRISGIDISRLGQDQAERLRHLEEKLKERVFGQDEAVKAVTRVVRTGTLGLKKPNEPMGLILFLGPSGTGKTALAEALALELFEDKTAMQRYDMSEFNGKDAVARVTNVVSQAMRRRPYCVNVFDEIEKGDRKILDLFLQIMDTGQLTDGLGLTASFANAITIITSNIGQEHFYNKDLTFEEQCEHALQDLRNVETSGFRNEVLNRVTEVCCFKPLDYPQIEKIASKRFSDLNKWVKERGFNVEISKEDLSNICEDFYKVSGGARSIIRYIKNNVDSLVAEQILLNPNQKGTLRVQYNRAAKKVDVILNVASATPISPNSLKP